MSSAGRRRTPTEWEAEGYSLEMAWAAFEFPPGIEPGGIPRRLFARLIDALVVALIPIALVLLGDHVPRDRATNALVGAAIVWGVYEPVMLWLLGATLGKLVMGIRVVRMDDLCPPSLVQAGLRWGCIVLFVLSLFRYVLAGLGVRSDDPGRQRGLPDRVAGTVVIRGP